MTSKQKLLIGKRKWKSENFWQNNQWLPVLASLIPFAAFFLLIPYPIYTDSFFYLNVVCHAEPILSDNPIEPFLFGIIPCNFFVIKLLLFCISALSLLAVIKTSEFWHKENGYLTGFFLIILPFWYIFFFQFENDQFSIPFAFWALYFFVKANFTGKKINYAIALGLISIAGIIWQANIVFLLALGMANLFFLLFAYVLLLVQWKQVPYLLFAYTTKAAENTFALGVLYWNWLIFGILLVPSTLFWPTTILIIAGILNAKLAFFALPFLAIGWTTALNKFLKKRPFSEQKIKKIILLGMICSQIISIYPLLQQMPTSTDLQKIQAFIDYAPEKEHKNDYGYGHIIRFLGGKPSAWAGGEWNQDYNHGIILTIQELQCQEIIESTRIPITNEKNGFTIYDCP